MIQQSHAAVLIVSIAGYAMSNEPVLLEPDSASVRHAGHIYFNIATGERITTLMNVGETQQPASSIDYDEFWVATTRAQCADFGYDTEHFFDLNQDEACSGTSCDQNFILLDWSEVPYDTVVDCVQIHWITDLPDTDTNSDGIADGVEGFSGTWVFWDAVSRNFANTSGCVSNPIVSFRFDNLQGHFPSTTDEVTRWTADIDLGSEFGTSLIFEIGDTDSWLQGAAFHNPRQDLQDFDSDSIPDFDQNENFLADWGWTVYFTEPGTVDLDNADGDSNSQTGIDGVFVPESILGIHAATSTPGYAEYDSNEDRWVWVSDGTTAGPISDEFILMTAERPSGTGLIVPSGLYFFGGFNCSPEEPDQYTPFAQFEIILYSPFRFDCADINGDSVLDFFDISLFLEIRYDYNGDDVFDFFDISSYLADFALGCP